MCKSWVRSALITSLFMGCLIGPGSLSSCIASVYFRPINLSLAIDLVVYELFVIKSYNDILHKYSKLNIYNIIQ